MKNFWHKLGTEISKVSLTFFEKNKSKIDIFSDIPQGLEEDFVNRSPQKYEAPVESPEPVIQKPQPPQPKPSALKTF